MQKRKLRKSLRHYESHFSGTSRNIFWNSSIYSSWIPVNESFAEMAYCMSFSIFLMKGAIIWFYNTAIIWNCSLTKTSFARFGHGTTQNWLLMGFKLGTFFLQIEAKRFQYRFLLKSLQYLKIRLLNFSPSHAYIQSELFHQASFPRFHNSHSFLSLKLSTTRQWHLIGQQLYANSWNEASFFCSS